MKNMRNWTLLLVGLVLCTGLAYGSIISEITEMTFNSEVLDADVPVLVWFYFINVTATKDPLDDPADRTARKYNPRVKILKMDGKYNIITAEKYKITRNNTFVLFVEGKEKARSTDIRSEKDLGAFIDKHVAPPEPSPKP